LGALIGSFANVVIYRVPRGESVVFPGSHCPHCDRSLRALELVPIASWVALRGRCRGCNVSIAARYPVIEALMALGFASLALRFPVETCGLTVLPLLALFALLLIAAVIDVDTHLLPDALTLPALAVGLLGTLLDTSGGLPTPAAALLGGCLGAGLLVLINRLGALVLRRFRDTRERLWPIGLDQVNLAALGGALGGWPVGLGVAGASLLLNLVTRRTLRLPEGPLYGLWALALALSPMLFVPTLTALYGSLVAAGAVAVLGAVYWWLRDLSGAPTPAEAEEDDEPVAMGFGDVKLAAVLGVMLGPQNLLVALLLSFIFGALGGVLLRALRGGRVVPFGPYLVLGGLAALFYGEALAGWYVGLLGI